MKSWNGLWKCWIEDNDRAQAPAQRFEIAGRDAYTSGWPKTALADLVMFAAPWLDAFLFGAVAAISLPIGEAIGALLRPSPRTIATIMAFGAGGLLAALSFELVLPPIERGHHAVLAGGLIIGRLTFVGLNHLLNKRGAFLRKAATLSSRARGHRIREVKAAVKELARIDILRSLTPKVGQGLVAQARHVQVPAGDDIVRQGESGDCLFVINPVAKGGLP